MTDTALQKLFALLEREKSLLMKGEIEAVAQQVEQKEALVEELREAGPLPDSDLSRLRDMANRNAALLEASREGLKAAVSRLREIRKAMLQLDTYGRDGNMTNLRETAPRVEKRA